MPELPEVETMRRGVQSVAGSRIVAVERPLCRKRPIRIAPRIDALRRRVLGRQIDQVGRIGKRVILHLDGPRDTIVLEPRMTGLVLLADPPTREHLRLWIALGTQHRRPLAPELADRYRLVASGGIPAR